MVESKCDIINYNTAGQKTGMTYFYDAKYQQLEAKYGVDYMRGVNKEFLTQQKVAGKEFWFSHDPWFYWNNPRLAPGFQIELEWLSNNFGFASITGLWYFIP